MEFEHLYLLGDADLRGALHVCPQETIEDEFALLRGEVKPKVPVVFVHSMGKNPMDLIGTEYPALYLFSDRVFELFRSNGFTGWDTYPVEVYDKDGKLIEGYQGISIYGSCGPIDNSMSEVLLKDPITPKGKPYRVWKGLYFDLDTWDGSDIFVPKTTGFMIVTERVKVAIEKARFKNFDFERLTEIERMISTL
jgi:hypothetical protein